MLFNDQYKTIALTCEGALKVKGSNFVSIATPVESEEEVKTVLKDLKNKHPKANHHCYAYQIGAGKEAFRYSDDREPSGTAGKPIFNVIRSFDLTNVLIVVIRYFGGSLLGVPGLIAAYKGSAVNSIENGEIITKVITEKYVLSFGYELLKDVNLVLRQSDAEIIAQKMENSCAITFEIVKSSADELISKIKSHHLLGDQCKIQVL